MSSRSRSAARRAKYAPDDGQATRVRDGAWRELGRDVAPRCESGWTGDRCSLPLHHDGPHSNETEPEARYAWGDR